MSEQRFVIREVTDNSHVIDILGESITKSELNRRLIAIHKLPEWEDCEKGISILIHGWGKKGEVHDYLPLCGLSIEEIKQEYPKEYAQAITEAEEFTVDQPSPAPTREEWRIWIQYLPRPAAVNSWLDAWLDRVEIWLEHGPWMRGK